MPTDTVDLVVDLNTMDDSGLPWAFLDKPRPIQGATGPLSARAVRRGPSRGARGRRHRAPAAPPWLRRRQGPPARWFPESLVSRHHRPWAMYQPCTTPTVDSGEQQGTTGT